MFDGTGLPVADFVYAYIQTGIDHGEDVQPEALVLTDGKVIQVQYYAADEEKTAKTVICDPEAMRLQFAAWHSAWPHRSGVEHA